LFSLDAHAHIAPRRLTNVADPAAVPNLSGQACCAIARAVVAGLVVAALLAGKAATVQHRDGGGRGGCHTAIIIYFSLSRNLAPHASLLAARCRYWERCEVRSFRLLAEELRLAAASPG